MLVLFVGLESLNKASKAYTLSFELHSRFAFFGVYLFLQCLCMSVVLVLLVGVKALKKTGK